MTTNYQEIKIIILEEAHRSPYTVHLGSTKMYHDLRETFFFLISMIFVQLIGGMV
jgi:hypothetical protein